MTHLFKDRVVFAEEDFGSYKSSPEKTSVRLGTVFWKGAKACRLDSRKKMKP